VQREPHVSERRACAALGQHRSTQRKVPRGLADEDRLTADIIALARQYGRYGYRKIAGMLRDQAGWVVNDKRVERIWRREGLKVPQKKGLLLLSATPSKRDLAGLTSHCTQPVIDELIRMMDFSK